MASGLGPKDVIGGSGPAYLGSLTRHVFETLAFHAHLALHVRVLSGRDPHHLDGGTEDLGGTQERDPPGLGS